MATTKLEDLTEQQQKEQTGKTAADKVEKVQDKASEFKPLILFIMMALALHVFGAQWPEVLGAYLAINGKSLLNISVKQALAPTQKKFS